MLPVATVRDKMIASTRAAATNSILPASNAFYFVVDGVYRTLEFFRLCLDCSVQFFRLRFDQLAHKILCCEV